MGDTKDMTTLVDALRDVRDIAKAMGDSPALGTADPRFWVVQERRWKEVPEGAGGEMRIWDGNGVSTLTCEDFARSWLDWLMEEADWDGTTDEVLLGTSVKMVAPRDGGNREDPWEWEVLDLDERKLADDIESGRACPGYAVIWLDWEYVTVDNTLFLTMEECDEHIRLNAYHYDHPRSFCMRAWRSPMVERLWTVLKETPWDDVIEMASAHESLEGDDQL